jgi:hypothetical protein
MMNALMDALMDALSTGALGDLSSNASLCAKSSRM